MNRYRILQFLKIVAFIISIFYIGWHVSGKKEYHDPSILITPFEDADNLYILCIVLLLMVLNWSVEAIKWKLLLDAVEPIRFVQSLRAVFSGVTVSFYTPNRIGEFAGRILHLEPGHRIRGALATFVGATAQAMITFQAGFIALYVLRNHFINTNLSSLILIATVLVVVALPVLWLQIPRLAGLKIFAKIIAKYPKYLEVFEHYKPSQLITIYCYSALRYLVFCTQQYFLLQIFGCNESFLFILVLSAFSFLLITIVPSIALGELGMRGGVNLFVFAPFFNNPPAILTITFLLWLINLAIPAFLGAAGLLYIKIKRPS